jgi:16S rRNA (uracil1498-N3)-methyltransferase
MHEHRFFAEGPLRPHSALALSPEESAHVAKVLRLGLGDEITLFDGGGTEATARIAECSADGLTVEIGQAHRAPPPPPPAVHTLVPWLGQPQRLDWLIEKLTEVRVERVSVCRTGRARPERRLERWRRLAIAAAKQSGQAWLPQIEVSSDGVLSQAVGDELKILLSEKRGVPPLRELLPSDPPATLAIAVGPEKGVSEEEEEEAFRRGWRLASLGDHRLRTETAALAALVGVRLLRP